MLVRFCHDLARLIFYDMAWPGGSACIMELGVYGMRTSIIKLVQCHQIDGQEVFSTVWSVVLAKLSIHCRIFLAVGGAIAAWLVGWELYCNSLNPQTSHGFAQCCQRVLVIPCKFGGRGFVQDFCTMA